MDKKFVSLTFVNSQTILCEIDIKSDAAGYYTLHNPMKPIAVSDANGSKIILVQMNPFSDSIEFKVHHSHVLSIGEMVADYIDIYNDAVHDVEQAIAKRYRQMMTPTDYDIDDFITADTIKTIQ